MALLIFALVVLIIAALAIYAADLLPIDGRLIAIVKVIIILIAIIAIAQRLV